MWLTGGGSTDEDSFNVRQLFAAMQEQLQVLQDRVATLENTQARIDTRDRRKNYRLNQAEIYIMKSTQQDLSKV
jgi:hypothetical protein